MALFRISKAPWLLLLLAMAFPARAEDIPVVCPKNPAKAPLVERADVYKGMPFKAGESATYEITWAGLKAGYGTLEVRKPQKYQDAWHRVFHLSASTGDWFKAVFVAREDMEAISRPADFGIAKFYMEQDEGKIFSRPFQQKKWLEFDHEHCKVTERIAQPGKPAETLGHELSYGANDAMGVVYNLRTRTYKMGQKERAPVYTSEKNWWLEAEPIAFEKVTVPAGTFDTVKLKLQTYIGKDLQQKGDVYLWMATNTPERQLVQVQGEIKIGSVWMKLHQYKAGGD